MKKRKYKKYICACMVALLVSSESITVSALDSEIRNQIVAIKSLAELDLEANAMSISILLDQCLDILSDDEPVKSTLQSVKLLLDSENNNSTAITVLLDTVLQESQDEANGNVVTSNQEKSDSGTENIMMPENVGETLNGTKVFPEFESVLFSSITHSDLELPVFEVENYEQTYIPTSVLVDVPSDWGNNAAGGRSLVSYSPVNASGAINPKAGTLTISYFSMEFDDVEETFAYYEKSIEDMSVTSDMKSQDVSTSNLPAKKFNFLMNVGANQFSCETVCFIYEETVYAIELLQGNQASYNYFPVLGQVVQSTKIALVDNNTENIVDPVRDIPITEDTEVIEEILDEETVDEAGIEANIEVTDTDAEEIVIGDAKEPQNVQKIEESVVSENSGQPEAGKDSSVLTNVDISSFIYQMNGHEYQFPTPVSEIAQEDISIDRQLYLPYDICSDADMEFGNWTEIINTEYFYFENSLYKEMTGITNMTGYGTSLSEGIVTALVDTNGSYLDIVLPGNIHVGSLESDIYNGFPAFKNQQMNGNARFVNNDYLYACNVRDDGCNGYVIVRNDDPFYSAVSIICEAGVIKEICFECLGSERADSVFEEVI